MSRRIFIPLLLSALLAACGGVRKSSQQELLRSAKVSGHVMGDFDGEISDLKLEQSDLPAGWTFANDLDCPSNQVRLMYEKHDLFTQLQQPVQHDFQTVVGPNGEKGSILYFKYPNEVTETESGFVAGMLWGAAKRNTGPSAEHPEDYLCVSNFLVIWCLPPGNEVKTISQYKIRKQIDTD
jgi:hypothetical protein